MIDRGLDNANRTFWAEPAGTNLARHIGLADLSPASLAAYDRSYLDYYPYLAPMLDPLTGDVLEVGLGFGTVASYLAGRVNYRGLDITAEPVVLAKERMRQAGRDPDVISQGSALSLPFPNESFDAVVSIGTLHHTGDLARGVAEVHRVLRPGGKALVMIYNAWSLRRMLHWRDRPESARARYDADSAGKAAPHTEFTSVLAARRLFAPFRQVHIHIENSDNIWRVPRRFLLGNVARIVGLDLYIKAIR